MNRTTRWCAALSAATLLSIGLVSPTATAAPAPTRAATAADRDLVEIPARAALRQAVEPSECAGTLLDTYINQLFADMTDEQFAFLVAHQDTLLSVPTYDALFFGTTGDPDYALGLQARQLQNTFRDLKRFWTDVEADDIQLLAMHGDVLLDADRIAATLTAMVNAGALAPMTPEQIRAEAQTVAAFMRAQGDFYDNPLWTLNALAFSGDGESDPVPAALPDKLVMGDGILAA